MNEKYTVKVEKISPRNKFSFCNLFFSRNNTDYIQIRNENNEICELQEVNIGPRNEGIVIISKLTCKFNQEVYVFFIDDECIIHYSYLDFCVGLLKLYNSKLINELDRYEILNFAGYTKYCNTIQREELLKFMRNNFGHPVDYDGFEVVDLEVVAKNNYRLVLNYMTKLVQRTYEEFDLNTFISIDKNKEVVLIGKYIIKLEWIICEASMNTSFYYPLILYVLEKEKYDLQDGNSYLSIRKKIDQTDDTLDTFKARDLENRIDVEIANNMHDQQKQIDTFLIEEYINEIVGI